MADAAMGAEHGLSEPNPLVSVVMIFLNGEEFIEEAIASVQSQTYPQWELILVDDGSNDRSSRIAQDHAESDPARIRYVTHPGGVNRGMSASRNLGIAHSRGEFVAFLDCDDVYLDEKLERQVGALIANPRASAVFGRTLSWYSWTGDPADRERDHLSKLDMPFGSLVEPPGLVEATLDYEVTPPATCGMLVRRSAIERIGGFEEQFRGLFEDQVFIFKLFAHEPVFISSDVLDRYRQHAGSTCYTEGGGDVAVYTPPREPYVRFHRWLDGYLHANCRLDARYHRVIRSRIRTREHPRLEAGLHQLRRVRRRTRRAFRHVRDSSPTS